MTTHGTGRRLKSGTCEGTKSSAQGIVEKTWSRAQLWGCCQWLLSDAILRRDELIQILKEPNGMRPERSQMISAPYPGRLPGRGGGLLLSQQLGHLVLFLQRMPSETSSLAFRRRTGRCDCSAPRSTRCAPGISRGHGGCRTKGVSTDRRRHLLEIHPTGVCQQDYWVVCEIRHVHAES